jgi:hypothetical protein
METAGANGLPAFVLKHYEKIGTYFIESLICLELHR